MKAAGVFVLICIAGLSTTAKADGKCERFEDVDWGSPGSLKTCYMHSTAIDSKNFSITSGRDESVVGFYSYGNKQLKHLPNNLGAKFPSLFVLVTVSCSIKEVSRDNFKGLGKLRQLYLDSNQIEKIDDDTFENIPAVEWINLEQNNIKKLNGRAFASLYKLSRVWLSSNVCINEDFNTATGIAELPRVVTEKCGFTELEPSSTKNDKLEGDKLMAKSDELKVLKQENAKLQARNAELIIEKAESDLQIAHLNELQALHNEIKAQLKEICDARIDLKVQENANLSNDLQMKTAEINEKNEKIKQCEKKIEIWSGNGP